MTPQQSLVALMFLLLMALSAHEYWQPELSALFG